MCVCVCVCVCVCECVIVQLGPDGAPPEWAATMPRSWADSVCGVYVCWEGVCVYMCVAVAVAVMMGVGVCVCVCLCVCVP